MKALVIHPHYGEITYTEHFWTGKKSITMNGHVYQIPKKEFMIDGKQACLKGSFYVGATLQLGEECIELSAKPKWYEAVLAYLPLVFLLVWGNSKALCSVFPVIGGAIGGAIGGLAMVTSMSLMKKTNSAIAKILIGLSIFAAAIGIAFVIALAFILVLAL